MSPANSGKAMHQGYPSIHRQWPYPQPAFAIVSRQTDRRCWEYVPVMGCGEAAGSRRARSGGNGIRNKFPHTVWLVSVFAFAYTLYCKVYARE